MSTSRRTFLKTVGQGVVAALVVSAVPSVVSALPDGRDQTLSYFPPGTFAPSTSWVHEVSTQEEYEHALRIAGPRDAITFQGPLKTTLQWVDVPESKDGLVIRNMAFYTSGRADSASQVLVTGCMFIGRDVPENTAIVDVNTWPEGSAFIGNMVYFHEETKTPKWDLVHAGYDSLGNYSKGNYIRCTAR